jgi:hypothetical protein
MKTENMFFNLLKIRFLLSENGLRNANREWRHHQVPHPLSMRLSFPVVIRGIGKMDI